MILTVEHPSWPKFVEALEGPKGCNFRKEPNDKGVERTVWTCSSKGHELSTPILESMGFDVDETIAYFRKHGGYCDCEVLFNVERSAKRVDKRPERKRSRLVECKAGKRLKR